MKLSLDDENEKKKKETYKIGSMEFDEPNEYIAVNLRDKQRAGGLTVNEPYVIGSMKFDERDKGKGKVIKAQQEKGLAGNTPNMWADDSVKYDPTALARRYAKPTAVPATRQLDINHPSSSTATLLPNLPMMTFKQYNDAVVSDGITGKKLAGAFGYGAEKTGAAWLEPVEKALDFVSAGINSGISGALKAGSTLTAFGGEQNKVSTALQNASDFVGAAAKKSLTDDVTGDWNKSADERYKPTDAQKNVANVTGTVTGMIPAIGLNFATGGGASALSAGGALMGLSAAGGGASEVARNGASTGTALRYGTLSGMTEVAIEKAFGGIPGLGEGVSDKTIKGAINKFLKNDFARKTMETFVDAAGEGAEEALSTALDPFLKRATYDNGAKNATAKEVGESAILGALSSLLLTGAFSVGDKLSGFSKPIDTQAPVPQKPDSTVLQSNAKNEIEHATRTDVQNTTGPENDVANSIYDSSITDSTKGVNGYVQSNEAEEKRSFLKQIDDYMHGRMDEAKTIVVGSTPPILKQFGANDLKLTMNQSAIRKIAYPEGYMGGKHNLGFYALEMLPEQLSDPVAILKSSTQKNSLVVLTEMVDENKQPVIVPVHLDKSGKIGVSNNIASMYGKDNIGNFIKKHENAGNLIYAKSKESLSTLPVTGLQLPEMIATKDPLYDSSIRQTAEKINGFNENIVSEQVEQKPSAELSPLLTDYRSQIANDVMKPFDLNRGAHISTSIDDAKAGMGDASSSGINADVSQERSGQTAKTAEYQRKQENFLVKDISEILGVPNKAGKLSLRPVVSELSDSIKAGKLDTAKADELFLKAYDAGIVVMEDFYEQYKDLKTELRTQGISISTQDKGDFDGWNSFRRQSFGSLKITDDGTPVDVKYDELSSRYPDLFSSDITHPADQLRQILEVAQSIKKVEVGLDEYYRENAGQHEEYARHEFNKRLDRYIDEIERVADVEKQNITVSEKTEAHIATVDELRAAHKTMKAAQKTADKVMANMLLTKRESDIVNDLLKETRHISELDELQGISKNDVLAAYEAKKAVAEQKSIIDGHKNAVNAALFEKANELIETSDQWKDKSLGVLYARETMDRNFEDITKNVKNNEQVKIGEQVAKDINDHLWKPVQDNEAASTRFKNEYSNRIRALKLQKYESQYAQMYGEWQYNSNYAKEHAENSRYAKKASETADNLAVKMNDLLKKHGKEIDKSKVKKAIPVFHKVYDELFEKIETTLLLNGFTPPEYRGGYFPHYNDTVLVGDRWYNKAGFALLRTIGVKLKASELPTDIAGLTHTFTPSKRWMGNLLERKGEATTYDALKGFDSYLENAADIIFHTEDIKRWRAFENAIRYKYSDDGVKDKYNKILAEDLDEAERYSRTSTLFEQDKSELSHLVQEVRSYTDSLAGKKSIHDRTVESDTGRAIYQTIQQVEGRIAANMIAGNFASALTNGIAMTQASAEVSGASMLKAAKDTLAAIKSDDGFVDRSKFLTNRRGYEPTHHDAIEVVADKLSKPSYYIDFFSANIIERGRVYDNLKKGMTEEQAIAEADKYTARLMADRSKGALPTVFNRKNPAAKLFTMFQVEVNNQLSYLFKDLPKNMRERGKLALVGALIKYMLGAFVYNELYEKVVGRRPALDPIGIVKEAFVAGNRGDAIDGAFSIANSIAQNAPFIGGLLGGGRLPISSAVPNIPGILEKVGDSEVSRKKKLDVALKEGSKLLYYGVAPVAGGQAKKLVEGTKAILDGGSFATNNDGERELQFPVDPTAGNMIGGPLFGKYSMSDTNINLLDMLYNKVRGRENKSRGAQAYIEKGFQPYSPKATEAFDILRNNGRKPTDATDILDEINAFKGEGSSDMKRDFLLNLPDVKPSDKTLLDDLMISELKTKKDYSSLEAFNVSGYTDAQKKKYAQAKEAFGMDTTEFTKYSKAINNIDGDKDADGKTIKGSAKKKKIAALIEMGMTNDKAEGFYKLSNSNEK